MALSLLIPLFRFLGVVCENTMLAYPWHLTALHVYGVCRTYTYTVRGVLAGNRTNLVSLTRADTNATNNNATSTVTVLGTCANPFGNGTQLNCPDGSVTNATAANNTFEDAGTFPSVCCVSVVCCVAWCVRGCSCWPRRQSVPWAHPQHMPCSSRVATTG